MNGEGASSKEGAAGIVACTFVLVSSARIGLAVYAKEADLWKAVERTMRKLYEELGASL